MPETQTQTMNWLKTLISGTDGSPSTMRVAVLMVLAAVLFNWIYLTIKTGSEQPLNWEEVGIIVGALAAKAVQYRFENPPTVPPKTP